MLIVKWKFYHLNLFRNLFSCKRFYLGTCDGYFFFSKK